MYLYSGIIFPIYICIETSNILSEIKESGMLRLTTFGYETPVPFYLMVQVTTMYLHAGTPSYVVYKLEDRTIYEKRHTLRTSSDDIILFGYNNSKVAHPGSSFHNFYMNITRCVLPYYGPRIAKLHVQLTVRGEPMEMERYIRFKGIVAHAYCIHTHTDTHTHIHIYKHRISYANWLNIHSKNAVSYKDQPTWLKKFVWISSISEKWIGKATPMWHDIW